MWLRLIINMANLFNRAISLFSGDGQNSDPPVSCSSFFWFLFLNICFICVNFVDSEIRKQRRKGKKVWGGIDLFSHLLPISLSLFLNFSFSPPPLSLFLLSPLSLFSVCTERTPATHARLTVLFLHVRVCPSGQQGDDDVQVTPVGSRV